MYNTIKMIYYSYLFLFLLSYVNAYNIHFFRGSFVDTSIYSNFVQQLQNHLPDSTIDYQNYVTCKKFEKDTILIGHSFGGVFALLYAMNNPENVKACILINSHFNHNVQMPYASISLYDIKQPVLCIFTDMDERLPCGKVFEDWEVAVNNKLNNKTFNLHKGTHFSIFTQQRSTEVISYRVVKFIKGVLNQE